MQLPMAINKGVGFKSPVDLIIKKEMRGHGAAHFLRICVA
jgi:hypothetical protein